MAEITDEQIETEIHKILKKANLATTSTKKVRQQVEKILKADLSSKKEIIDKMVMSYVESQRKDESDGEEEEEDDVNSSEEELKSSKKHKASSEENSEEEVPKKKPAKRAAPTSKGAKKRKPSTEEDDATVESDSEEERRPSPKKKGRKKKGGAGDSDSDWGKKKAKKAGGRAKGSGYTRAYKLSPALSELMGTDEMPRHEVVKQVWAIIKEKKLYDPNNKQFAICDDALYKVFQTKRFRTFGMMKYLKNHFLAD